MTRRTRRGRRPSRGHVTKRRRGRLWRRVRFLGLLSVALVAIGALLGKQTEERSRAAQPRNRRRHTGDDLRDDGDGPSADTGSSPAATGPFALPDDARVAWVPSPSGGVRLCERRPAHDDEIRGEMIFVHGLGGRLEHWAAQLEALGPALVGVALDLPGHGGSDPSQGADAVEGAAAALGAAIDACALRRPLVVAHGWGALAALRWAAARPGRARGLLLIDPPGDQSRMTADDVDAFRQAVVDDARGELGLFLRQSLADVAETSAKAILADVEATDDDVLLAALESSTRATPAADAEAAKVPLHLVTSDLGRGPHALEKLVEEAVPWHLQTGGHWLMVAQPARFNQLLDDVVDALRLSR